VTTARSTDTTNNTSAADRIEARANELLNALTVEEKCRMLYGDLPFWKGLALVLEGAYGRRTWNAGSVPRLGIEGVRFADGPRGVVLHGATTFPVPMARAATFDAELEERIGNAMGRELRALGGNLFGGICINLLRHPAWGRAQETYGEDPCLLGEFGAACIRGVQQHVMGCVKHFALNSMENARFSVDVKVSPRALHEIYLPHFKRAVDAGVSSVMSSYNSVNGEWCGQNQYLLSGVLKNRWGFRGFVVTDFIFGMRDSKAAITAGQDLEMPFHLLLHKDLQGLVTRGEVPMSRIDDACLRHLREQLRAGLTQPSPASIVGCDEHIALSREAAQKSMVLLKNDGALLPLAKSGTLAVIGKLAAVPNTGDGGSSKTHPRHVVTPLEGIRAGFGGTVVQHDAGDIDAAARVAASADAVVLVVGYTSADEGEFISPDANSAARKLFPKPRLRDLFFAIRAARGIKRIRSGARGMARGGDRVRLCLSDADEALILAVVKANPRTVVAVMAGSAVTMEAWRRDARAILMMWYPGMEGGHALADVLFGRVNPSGRLPFVVPSAAADLPFFDKDATSIEYDLWHGYRKLERDGNLPAFPFGFGLSYTTFAYRNLDASLVGSTLVATLDVRNTGPVDGAEVVQLYVAALGSRVERAPKELKAFARVRLNSGEMKRVTMRVSKQELAYFDEALDAFVLEPLDYEVIVGAHSLDENALRMRIRID
jgi:beta-glucosidase